MCVCVLGVWCVCVVCVCNSVAKVFAVPMTVCDCIRLIFVYSVTIIGNQLKFLLVSVDCRCFCLHFQHNIRPRFHIILF